MSKFKVGDWVVYKKGAPLYSYPPRQVIDVSKNIVTYKPGMISDIGRAFSNQLELAPQSVNFQTIKKYLKIK